MDRRKISELCRGNAETILQFFMSIDKEINRIIKDECNTDEQRKKYKTRKEFMTYAAAKTLLAVTQKDKYPEELEIINSIRNMRVAAILNYRMHEKATEFGLELASQFYVNSFRCYEDIDEDFENQSKRMQIHNRFWDNTSKHTALDIELMGLLLFQCEYDCDERDKIFDRLKTIYIKEFDKVGLSTEYTEEVCEQDIDLWLDLYGIDSRNISF